MQGVLFKAGASSSRPGLCFIDRKSGPVIGASVTSFRPVSPERCLILEMDAVPQDKATLGPVAERDSSSIAAAHKFCLSWPLGRRRPNPGKTGACPFCINSGTTTVSGATTDAGTEIRAWFGVAPNRPLPVAADQSGFLCSTERQPSHWKTGICLLHWGNNWGGNSMLSA